MKSLGRTENLKLVPPLSEDYSPTDLVNGVIARDKRVLDAFFDRYSGQINGMVTRLLGPDQEESDVVNTVFEEILKSIGRMRDPQALTHWVSMVTVQTVRREIRGRVSRRRFVVFRDTAEDLERTGTGSKGQLSHDVYRVLRKFPEDEYIYFILYYVEGHNLEEIAQLTRSSLSTVKRRSKRSKERFLAMIKVDRQLQSAIEEWKHD